MASQFCFPAVSSDGCVSWLPDGAATMISFLLESTATGFWIKGRKLMGTYKLNALCMHIHRTELPTVDMFAG